MLIRTCAVLVAAGLVLTGCSSMMLTGGGSTATRAPAGTGDQRPTERASDAAISARIRARLDGDPAIAGVAVRTAGGRVTLGGSVGSYAARNQAYRLARQTEGVLAVVNQISVEE